MISVLSWVVFGIVIGIIDNFLSKKPGKENLLGTILLGVLGSVLGGLLGNLLLSGSIETFQLISFFIAASFAFSLLAMENWSQNK